MRTRQITNDSTIGVWEQEINTLTGQIYYDVTSSAGCENSRSRLMIDEVTPHWSKARASGQVIMNSLEYFDSTITAYSRPKNYVLWRQAFNGTTWDDDVKNQGYSVGPWSARVRIPRTPIPNMSPESRAAELLLYGDMGEKGDEILTEALSRATSADALSLVTVAELDKTFDLVKQIGAISFRAANLLESLGPSRVRKLNELMRNVYRRGYLKPGGRKRLAADAGKQLAAAASAWLGYRYGVMATYWDLKSWVGAANTSRRARVVAGGQTDFESDTGLVLQDENEWRSHYRRTLRKRKTTVRAGVLIDPALLTEAQRHGVQRVAETAWELIPFSFVIDWFVDVGTKIAAFEGGVWVKPLGSWLSYTHELIYQGEYYYNYRQYQQVSPPVRWLSYGENSGVVTEMCRYVRRVPNPRLSASVNVKVSLNGKRLLDAVSLLATSSKRIRRSIRT